MASPCRRSARVAQMKRFLREQNPNNLPLVEEYISEGEHMDGEDYWDLFASPEAAQADFLLFLEALDTNLE